MLLNEFIDKHDAYTQIADFLQNWQFGHYHDHEYVENIPPGMFSLIKKFMPSAIFTGQVYRGVWISRESVLKSNSIQDLSNTVKLYKQPNKSPLFAWSSSTQGIKNFLYSNFGDESQYSDSSGEAKIFYVFSQKTSKGISFKKAEEFLIKQGLIKSKSRASYVSEIIAPLEPPIQPQEFVVLYTTPDKKPRKGKEYEVKTTFFSPRNFTTMQSFLEELDEFLTQNDDKYITKFEWYD